MPIALTDMNGYQKIQKSKERGGTLHVTPDGVPFRSPRIEREGVADRRVAYVHAWSERDLIWIRERKHFKVLEADLLPGDWRSAETVA